MITGAGTARRIPALIPLLAQRYPRLFILLTPNAQRVIAGRELALIPGHRIIESYFDEAILPRPPLGLALVAPCGFNSLNKLAQGIADNLALSVVAEAIGRRTPVVVAIGVNTPLWEHPRARESASTLRSWGCTVLDPVPDEQGFLTLAPLEEILAAVDAADRAYNRRPG